MIIVSIIATCLILLIAALIILPKIIVDASYINNAARFSIKFLFMTLFVKPSENKWGISLGRWTKTFSQKPSKKRVRKPKVKSRKTQPLPWYVWIKIIKALILFIGRILSRVHYETGYLDLEPVFTNPALAGAAYGWSRAFYGIFPGMEKSIALTPRFEGRQSGFSGRLTVSILNRQIAYAVYRLFRELPIKKMINHYIGSRG